MDFTKKQLLKSTRELYTDIDDCICKIVESRLRQDIESEEQALLNMETLMVNSLQQLSCIIDFLKEKKMKTKELQIGNFVYNFNITAQMLKVVGLATRQDLLYLTYDGKIIECNIDDIEPIPITNNLLESNDFVSSYSFNGMPNLYKKVIKDFIIEFNDNISNMPNRKWNVHIDNSRYEGIASCDVQYVHQVQNLINIIGINEEIFNNL